MIKASDNVKVKCHNVVAVFTAKEFDVVQRYVLKVRGRIHDKRIPCGTWARDLILKEVGYKEEEEKNVQEKGVEESDYRGLPTFPKGTIGDSQHSSNKGER